MKNKGMSWPVMLLIIGALLVVGYGIGQYRLSQQHKAATTVSTVSTQH